MINSFHSEEVIEKVKIRMREIIEQNLPIRKQAYNIDKARELFDAMLENTKEYLGGYKL